MQRVPSLLFLAAAGLALAAGVRAWAGTSYANTVSIYTDSSGRERLSGPFMGARFTSIRDNLVACSVTSWARGTKYASCYAYNSSDYFSCTVTDPDHIERIQQMSAYGGDVFIMAHPTNGTCEYLRITQSSGYIWN